jgi:hypothetical protein
MRWHVVRSNKPRFTSAVAVPLLVAALVLGACSKKEERMYFEGNYYPAKTRTIDKADRKNFSASVRRADQGLKGALAAGAHEGKTYCLKNFGTSEIVWRVGPDAPEATFGRGASSITLTGACQPW